MKEREAIRELEWAKNRLMQNSHMDNNRITAFNMAISALDKEIPKKPRNERMSIPLSRTSVRFVDWYKCGKCNSDLSKQFVCCPYCQSVIDWSDVD